MEYWIAFGDSPAELLDAVNRMITQGWTPLGGIAVVQRRQDNAQSGRTEGEVEFYQAMIRRPST